MSDNEMQARPPPFTHIDGRIDSMLRSNTVRCQQNDHLLRVEARIFHSRENRVDRMKGCWHEAIRGR